MSYSFTRTGRSLTLAAMLALPLVATAQSVDPVARALSHLNSRRAALGLTEADLRDPAVTSQYTDADAGVTHLYLRQRVHGVEVYGAVADVHLDRSGRVRAAHSAFVGDAAAQARPATPTLTAEQAVAAAAQALHLPLPQSLRKLRDGSPAAGLLLSDGGISLENIPARLMYLPQPDGQLVLTWNVTIYPKSADHYWDARVDAATGQLLDRTDFVVGEEASFAALARRQSSAAAPAATPGPSPVARPLTPNSYQVLAMPTESPSHGTHQLVVNPANAQASPFGWHDTNGVAGAEYTTTRGNNVDAYEDRANLNTLGYLPDGGPTLAFNFPFATTANTRTNQNAAITNLFYWNNVVHDVMERHGFTEAAGNFQVRNYGNQGLGNDAVQAEAQDGAGLNNANFGTPPDGTRPRMQMFLWNQPGFRPLTVTAPTSASYSAGEAFWAASLEDVGPIADTVIATEPLRACSPLTNASRVRGNIALVQRGVCSIKLKVLQAQQAGARLVILTDTVAAATSPFTPANDPAVTTPITIPVMTVTLATGNALRAALATGPLLVTATAPPRRDGDFDNGIIAHEYGHGISTRLTGGPANSNCLGSREQMGEGWSDFFGLWLTTRPGDVATTPRGVGTYAQFQATNGRGIRTLMYTTDMQVNTHTYRVVGTPGYTGVHAIGEIWATILWDLNWALIGRHGYNADLYGTTGGNNIALKLVLDGCKLQPCNPGFVDGRNAILRADSLSNGAANSALIWQVFARRGLGFSAQKGSANSLNDQVEAFDLPAVLATKTKLSAASLAVFPNPAQDRVTVRLLAASQRPVLVELVNNLGQVVQRTTAPAAQLQQNGVDLSTAQLPAGLYVVRLTGSTGTATQKLLVRH